MAHTSAPAITTRPAHYVGEIVEFHPPVSGGIVIAVVTKVINRTTVALRVTDGTATYPTGSFTTTSTGWVN